METPARRASLQSEATTAARVVDTNAARGPASLNAPPHDFPLPMARRPHYRVYVVELARAVLDEPRFRRANPGYVDGMPCYYVGMTGLDPDVRFDKHKAGLQANRYVQRYGLRLRPDLYTLYGVLTYDEARALEVELGIDLREAGNGVWQA